MAPTPHVPLEEPGRFTDLAREIISGHSPTQATLAALAQTPDHMVLRMMAGADLIRRHHFGNGVHLCAINNAKSGKCSENCSFCAQSGAFDTGIDTYPLKSGERLYRAIEAQASTPLHRYSMVTSGKGLPSEEVSAIAGAAARGGDFPQRYCASLGILETEDFNVLKAAGINRYHHNLETAPSHFGNICTTHTFEERVRTIKKARDAGMSVCAGGIFGVGETMDQVIELAMVLKDLDVDAVPVNFLTPAPGTPFENQPALSPLACLRIISLLRFILPAKEIIVCGGRLASLKHLHSLVFFAGASGIMTGSYLTTPGNQMEEDLEMLRQLGMCPRPRA